MAGRDRVAHGDIDHPGYERLVTHLFRQDTEFLDSDVVFGVKDQLIVPFTRHPAGSARMRIEQISPGSPAYAYLT